MKQSIWIKASLSIFDAADMLTLLGKYYGNEGNGIIVVFEKFFHGNYHNRAGLITDKHSSGPCGR